MERDALSRRAIALTWMLVDLNARRQELLWAELSPAVALRVAKSRNRLPNRLT